MGYCSKCGTKLSDGAKYCPMCGNSIDTTKKTVNSPQKASSSNRNMKQIENDSLNKGQIIALSISALFAFIGLCGGAISASDGIWSILIVSILASAAIFFAFVGAIDRKYAWSTAIGSFLAVFVAIGASAPSKERAPKEKHFSELLPDDDSTTFIVEGCKPIGDDGLVIKSIDFFEKNDTKDFRLDDKKEATFQGKEYEYYTFWCTGFTNYNFYVDADDYLYCSFAFWDNDKDVGKAFQSGAIGKIKIANKKEVEKAKEEAKKEAEKLQSKYVGIYFYSFFIQNTNASLYFKITLKSDGTFTHEPSNDTTKNYTDMESIIDGKDYPTGGTWSVSSDGIRLDFNGSWSGGKISADMKKLEIYNMNGYNLKTSISR